MLGTYVAAGIAVLVLIYIIGTYNALVRLRQHMQESWSGIDTELKRRYDLIPNLIETVKGYAVHERETLNAVIEARARAVSSTGTPDSQARDEGMLVSTLRQLFAVVEAYPQLKANQNFLHLQEELVITEDRIQATRRFYNGNVRDLNTRVAVFPSNLIASIFGIRPAEFFDVAEAVRTVPEVEF
jgi:LemA protein